MSSQNRGLVPGSQLYFRTSRGLHYHDLFGTEYTGDLPWWHYNCHNCGRVGHRSSNCDQPQIEPRCLYCGEAGHVSLNCELRMIAFQRLIDLGFIGHDADVNDPNALRDCVPSLVIPNPRGNSDYRVFISNLGERERRRQGENDVREGELNVSRRTSRANESLAVALRYRQQADPSNGQMAATPPLNPVIRIRGSVAARGNGSSAPLGRDRNIVRSPETVPAGPGSQGSDIVGAELPTDEDVRKR